MSTRDRSLLELLSQASAAGEGWKGAKGAAGSNLGCLCFSLEISQSWREHSRRWNTRSFHGISVLFIADTPPLLWEVQVAFWILSARDTLLWKRTRTFLVVRWLDGGRVEDCQGQVTKFGRPWLCKCPGRRLGRADVGLQELDLAGGTIDDVVLCGCPEVDEANCLGGRATLQQLKDNEAIDKAYQASSQRQSVERVDEVHASSVLSVSFLKCPSILHRDKESHWSTLTRAARDNIASVLPGRDVRRPPNMTGDSQSLDKRQR